MADYEEEKIMKEGEVRILKQVCKRRECEVCSEPASHMLSFLLPNARGNPASSACGKDDISWCSDMKMFVCEAHEKDRRRLAGEKGMEWCATYSFDRFKHMFLYWEKEK